MTTVFEVLFLLALFGPPLAIVTGLVVFTLGVMTDRSRNSSNVAHEALRAA